MNSFLEDIEFASKVNEEIKKAEQRGIDNSLELTKEMIKQQYGDIEKLKKALLDIKELQDNYLEEIYKGNVDLRLASLTLCKIDNIVNEALGDKGC